MIEGILYFLAALAILLFMITIHELGHYTVGKILKFKINEFAIGMGPALFKKKNKKTGEVFSIRLIPLGGYCAFEGETESTPATAEAGEAKSDNRSAPQPEQTTAERGRAFVDEKPWKRLIVFVAGAAFNFISAILIVIVAFAVFGSNMPAVYGIVPGEVGGMTVPDGAASAAWEAKQAADLSGDYSHCLLAGDIILEINGKKVYLQGDLANHLALSGNEDTTMLVLRDGVKTRLTGIKKKSYLAPKYDENQEFESWQAASGLGIYLSSGHVSFTFGESIVRSVPFCFSTATAILDALGQLITGTLGIRDALGGPISTIDFTMSVVQTGFANILYLITMISVNLAIFNLLPIPALDGSKIIFTTIEWIRGKPINRKIENYIHVIGLLLLFTFVILLDIIKILT